MKPASTASHPSSRQVLVVEDEALIAMVLEDMLDLLGHRVVATATSFAEADAAVRAGGFDLVIADVNLAGEAIFPLADQLRAAGIDLILATGAHPDSLPPRFAGVPVVEKPYASAAIAAALDQLV